MSRPEIQRLTGRTIIYSKSGNDPAHDSLMLPTGKTIAETPTEELRAIFVRFKIENAHTDGRAIICSRYAALVSDVFNKAGEAALKAFLRDRP
jgi:hypothetical protein